MFYPVSDLLNPVTFQAPPSVPKDGALPKIVLLSTDQVRCLRAVVAHSKTGHNLRRTADLSSDHSRTPASIPDFHVLSNMSSGLRNVYT